MAWNAIDARLEDLMTAGRWNALLREQPPAPLLAGLRVIESRMVPQGHIYLCTDRLYIHPADVGGVSLGHLQAHHMAAEPDTVAAFYGPSREPRPAEPAAPQPARGIDLGMEV